MADPLSSDNQYLRRGKALASERFRRRKSPASESLGRKALDILLPLGLMAVVIMAGVTMLSLSNDFFENVVVVDGLHIALPSGMDDFPAELVPKP